MSYFERSTLEIGLCVAGTTRKVEFKGLNNVPAIKNIIPGCGCTDFKFDNETKVLHIVYNVGSLPKHLTGPIDMEKHFKIEYREGGSEVLTFSGSLTNT